MDSLGMNVPNVAIYFADMRTAIFEAWRTLDVHGPRSPRFQRA